MKKSTIFIAAAVVILASCKKEIDVPQRKQEPALMEITKAGGLGYTGPSTLGDTAKFIKGVNTGKQRL